MKTLILAAGVLAIGAGAASAQGMWRRDEHPYAERHHSFCQVKARRLHDYERRAASDGRISPREHRTIEALRRDLDHTCGRFRWRG